MCIGEVEGEVEGNDDQIDGVRSTRRPREETKCRHGNEGKGRIRSHGLEGSSSGERSNQEGK